jgi:hypothetical protein
MSRADGPRGYDGMKESEHEQNWHTKKAGRLSPAPIFNLWRCDATNKRKGKK